MAKIQTLISGVNGINNRINPKRLPINFESKIGFAAEIVNMRVTTDGSVERDYGNETILSGNYHSMYCGKNACYAGNAQSIYRFFEDETVSEIVTGLSGNRFSYTSLGDLVFYSDTVANIGMLNGSNAYPWRDHSYLETTNRIFVGAPIARHMAVLNGRMYMVPADEPTTILWSERGQVGLYNRSDNFRRLESDIIMIAQVTGGLFLSTRERIVFMRIESPHRVTLETKAPYPAIEWAVAQEKKNCSELGLESAGECRFWRSVNGHCVGTDSGDFFNLTNENILMPNKCNNSGASIIIGNYLYSSSM